MNMPRRSTVFSAFFDMKLSKRVHKAYLELQNRLFTELFAGRDLHR